MGVGLKRGSEDTPGIWKKDVGTLEVHNTNKNHSLVNNSSLLFYLSVYGYVYIFMYLVSYLFT